MLSKYGKISWINNRLVYLNTDQLSTSGKTTEYEAYISAENYILNSLKNNITKKINKNNYYKILSNMFDLFVLSRITIIKKRNSNQNIKYLITYIKDLFFLSKKRSLKGSVLFFLVNLVRLLRSIL